MLSLPRPVEFDRVKPDIVHGLHAEQRVAGENGEVGVAATPADRVLHRLGQIPVGALGPVLHDPPVTVRRVVVVEAGQGVATQPTQRPFFLREIQVGEGCRPEGLPVSLLKLLIGSAIRSESPAEVRIGLSIRQVGGIHDIDVVGAPAAVLIPAREDKVLLRVVGLLVVGDLDTRIIIEEGLLQGDVEDLEFAEGEIVAVSVHSIAVVEHVGVLQGGHGKTNSVRFRIGAVGGKLPMLVDTGVAWQSREQGAAD